MSYFFLTSRSSCKPPFIERLHKRSFLSFFPYVNFGHIVPTSSLAQTRGYLNKLAPDMTYTTMRARGSRLRRVGTGGAGLLFLHGPSNFDRVAHACLAGDEAATLC
jgi:hypothetical protein